MNNVSDIKDCYGCGVCATACPKNIIEIRLNKAGFYEPYIVDASKCINCSLCVNVCAFSHIDTEYSDNQPDGYATWSLNPQVRMAASSGGTGYEIARHLMKQGYLFCGVRYNAETGRAEHFVTDDEIELAQSMGSKYIQSFTTEAFNQLDRKHKYIITGTPCQMASMRKYIRQRNMEENFVLMDFFCHGVPSMHLWRKYVECVEKKVGNLTYAAWRSKLTGWHDSWSMDIGGERSEERVDWSHPYQMQIREKKGFVKSKATRGDLFYWFFFGHLCLGKQCVKSCRFKMTNSVADIRIGDLWGDTYSYEDKGVTGLLALTERGKAIIAELGGVQLIREPVATVCEGQMPKNAHNAPMANAAQRLLRSSLSISVIYKLVYLLQAPYKVCARIAGKK